MILGKRVDFKICSFNFVFCVKKKRHLAMFLIYESIVFIKKNIYNSRRLTS